MSGSAFPCQPFLQKTGGHPLSGPRALSEIDRDDSELQALNRMLGKAVGRAVDALSQNGEIPEIENRKKEALECLAYVRDVLNTAKVSSDLDEGMLVGPISPRRFVERAAKRPRHHNPGPATDKCAHEETFLHAPSGNASLSIDPSSSRLQANLNEVSVTMTQSPDAAVSAVRKPSPMVLRHRPQRRPYSMPHHPTATKNVKPVGDKHGQIGLLDTLRKADKIAPVQLLHGELAPEAESGSSAAPGTSILAGKVTPLPKYQSANLPTLTPI